jgi:hypothetical protein
MPAAAVVPHVRRGIPAVAGVSDVQRTMMAGAVIQRVQPCIARRALSTCVRRVVLAGAVLTCLTAGCKDEIAPDNGDSPSNIVFPPSNVSYAVSVQPLFNQTCALVGCHDDGQHQSALKLTSYDNLMFGSLPVVNRGDPANSILVLRIEGRLQPRMPLNRNSLNQNQVDGIRAWIGEGALNN